MEHLDLGPYIDDLAYVGFSDPARTKWIELEATSDEPFGCAVAFDSTGKKFKAVTSKSDKIAGVLIRGNFDPFGPRKCTPGQRYKVATAGAIIGYGGQCAIEKMACSVRFRATDSDPVLGAFQCSGSDKDECIPFPGASFARDANPRRAVIIILRGAL